jgi:hypothetical protein
MTIQFHCPSCHALLSTETSNAGSIVSCAHCHKDMVVPHVSPPVALPVPTIPVVPAVPLLKITCPSCGITGEIADRGGPHLKPIKCRQCGTRFQPQSPTASVPPPVKTIDDELLPYIEPEPLRDQNTQRGKPLRIDLVAVGIVGLVLVLGDVIFFNLPNNDGHQGNVQATARAKAEGKARRRGPSH